MNARAVRFSVVVLIGAGMCSIAAGNTPLQSPWDSQAVTASDARYSCPGAPQLVQDFATNSYFIDEQHSIADPVLKRNYEESVAEIDNFTRAVVKAADAYQTKGSTAAAQCVFRLLDSAAQQKAMAGKMDGHQAYYVQGSNLGAWAVAYLKVRGSGLGSEDQVRAITSWLKNLAEENREYYEGRRLGHHPNDSDNHQVYWAGFAVAAVGISNDDEKLFQWGMDAYKQGVRDIQADGTLPREMARGQMALHSHLYALAPLIMLAEFGESNGVPLYSENDYAIKRLVARCVSGLQDPTFFQQHTEIAQVMDPDIKAWEIGWGQPYTRRFPDPGISKLMEEVRYLGYTMLGGLPPP